MIVYKMIPSCAYLQQPLLLAVDVVANVGGGARFDIEYLNN